MWKPTPETCYVRHNMGRLVIPWESQRCRICRYFDETGDCRLPEQHPWKHAVSQDWCGYFEVNETLVIHLTIMEQLPEGIVYEEVWESKEDSK